MRRSSVAFALVLALAGCGPDLETFCERVSECEVDDLDAYDECVREGEARQRQAERADCEDEFITLLECLEATYVCGGGVQTTDCEAQSDALEACSIR